MRAPVQVLVIGFDEATFSGEVLAELDRLRDAGIIRLLDVLLVRHLDDGSFETLDGQSGLESSAGALAAAVLGGGDGDGDGRGEADDEEVAVWSLRDAVPVGSTAAVALIEHLWAGPLKAAIERSGGKPLDETWLPPGELERLDPLVPEGA